MCGTGGADRQQRAAQEAERQRLAQIEATQRRIEEIYGSPQREQDIQGVIGATRQFLGQDLDRKNAEAQRKSKFALARSGQTMGSVDVDTKRALGEQYLRSTLEAERRAQQAGNSLRIADQNAKLNLFSQAQAGLNMTTAERQAGQSLRANLGQASAEATQQGIGDAFSLFADSYKRSLVRRGEQDAEKRQYNTFYQPNQYWARSYNQQPFG